MAAGKEGRDDDDDDETLIGTVAAANELSFDALEHTSI